NNPVPNSFSAAGGTQVTSRGYNESGVSWAQANPQQTFPMEIPNAFVRVVLHKNSLQFAPEGIPLPSINDYGFSEDSTDSIPFPVGCGTIQATAYVGLEYPSDTLYEAIMGPSLYQGDTFNYLLQRVQEMVPNYSMGSLIAKLTACSISTDDSDQNFDIY